MGNSIEKHEEECRFLNVVEAAKYLGIGRSTLDHYRCEGKRAKIPKAWLARGL